MASFRLTRDAERDVIDIYLYSVEQFGAPRADQYLAEMQERFAQLATHPHTGEDVSAIYPNARRALYISHVLYYREDQDGILILRILHKRMDPARHLFTE